MFRYLKKTKTLWLVLLVALRKDAQHVVGPMWGYVDSDWAGCPDSRHSTSGFIFMLNCAAISWRSKHQPTLALSSAEA